MTNKLRRTWNHPTRTSRTFASEDVQLETLIEGRGTPVVMIPSLGRAAQDFDDLAKRVVAAGYMAVRPQPRGVGGSAGAMSGVRLGDLANDVAIVIEALRRGPAVVVGHAFGQRVARMLATVRPDLVSRLVLLAAGGGRPVPERVRAALSNCFDKDLPTDVHLHQVRYAFFAAGNDPAAWRDGWHPDVARMQLLATQGLAHGAAEIDETGQPVAIGCEVWHAGGTAPILVVQGLEDVVAPPEYGRSLRDQFGDRIQLIEIPRAGHALLPEAPQAIADAMLEFIRRGRAASPTCSS